MGTVGHRCRRFGRRRRFEPPPAMLMNDFLRVTNHSDADLGSQLQLAPNFIYQEKKATYQPKQISGPKTHLSLY